MGKIRPCVKQSVQYICKRSTRQRKKGRKSTAQPYMTGFYAGNCRLATSPTQTEKEKTSAQVPAHSHQQALCIEPLNAEHHTDNTLHICSRMTAKGAISSMPCQSHLGIETSRTDSEWSIGQGSQAGWLSRGGSRGGSKRPVYMGPNIVHSPFGRLTFRWLLQG